MISFDYKNVFRAGEHGLSESDFENFVEKNFPLIEAKIEQKSYGFLNFLDDLSFADSIHDFCKNNATRFEYFAVLGIGGSALGASCIAEALLDIQQWKKFFVLDNVDPALLADFEKTADLSKTLFIVVSKSGSTPETIAQYFYFRKKVSDSSQFVFVTDCNDGFLHRTGKKESVVTFFIPHDVGGRFSVLTACGLVPAGLLGIDILSLAHGGVEARKFVREAFSFAAIQYLLLQQKNVSMTVMMPYGNRLAQFSDWYAQLLAESIGKEKNLHGETVHAGLTPIKALGATDQHSQMQLYTSGPFDKLITFLQIENLAEDFVIPSMYEDEKDFSFLHGVTFHQLLNTEKRATENALTQYQRPNLTFSISELNASHLGELFVFFEMNVAFLGELLAINAFDQPGVELGKVMTKKLLS